jgi:hypothetical protein
MDLRRAFTRLGWTVTSVGWLPSSDDDWIEMHSDGRELEPETVRDILLEYGLTTGDYSFDLQGFGHEAEKFVDARWWDACPEPRGLLGVYCEMMLKHWRFGLPEPAGPRKAVLVTAAVGNFCNCWEGKVGPVLEALECFADGTIPEDELRTLHEKFLGCAPPYVLGVTPQYDGDREVWYWLAHLMVHRAFDEVRRQRAREEPIILEGEATWDRITAVARVQVAGVVRDVLGNPFRVPVIDPTWLTWDNGTIANLARGIYDERDFERMPILGDALEEAGCTDEHLLGHCHAGGTHVRGCWVLDLLLGN